jgi:hypothetical protein
VTDRELADAVWNELTKTTDSYPTWKRKGFPSGTHWSKAKAFNDQIGVAPPPPPPPPPDGAAVIPWVGISNGWQFPFRSDADRAFELGQMVSIGAKVCRNDYTAGSESQKNRTIDECNAKGIKSIAILGGTKRSWTDYDAFVAWCETSVRNLIGKTDLFEVCNEPDLNGATPVVYGHYAAGVCAAIKRANPNAARIVGALFDGQGGPAGYIQACIDAGADFTHVSLHLYDDPAEHGSWSMWDRAYPRVGGYYNGRTVRELLDAHGLSHVPIISTESGGPVPKYTLAKQAQIVTNAIGEAKAGRIGSCLIYTMLDDDVAGFGMLDMNRNKRPAWDAFHAAAS